MIVQRYKNRKGEVVHIESEHEIELADIEWLIQNPKIDDVSAYPSRDACKANQYLLYWGERIDTDNSRIAQNKGKMCAILLDYDDGYTIDTFNEKFNGRFQYYIYTSFSHTPTHHKFRVIIPTTESYEMTAYLVKVLEKCFPISIKNKETKEVIVAGSDSTTFNKRGFYEPVKVSEHYTYFISNGPIFDVEKRLGSMVQKVMEEDEAEQKRILADREARRVERESKGLPPPNLEFQKEWTTNKLQGKYGGCGSRKSGHRYSDLVKYCTALLKAEYWSGEGYMFDVDEVEDLILGEYDDANVRSMINGMLRTVGR